MGEVKWANEANCFALLLSLRQMHSEQKLWSLLFFDKKFCLEYLYIFVFKRELPWIFNNSSNQPEQFLYYTVIYTFHLFSAE